MAGGLTVAVITGLIFPDWLQHVGVESDDRVGVKHALQHVPVHRLQQPRGGQPQHQPPSQDNHTPSHPNGHKNPANGEMSPQPDQTGSDSALQQMQDKDI